MSGLSNLLLVWWAPVGFYTMSNAVGCPHFGEKHKRKRTNKQTNKDTDHTTQDVNTKRMKIWITNAKETWKNTHKYVGILKFYEGWNFNSGNYLFTTDTK